MNDVPQSDRIDGDSAVELSSNRTSLSFERTHMSADRTLMSTLRTSLSLIGFGFTIYEAFHQAARAHVLPTGDTLARNVGIALLTLGITMLALGVVGHWRFSAALTTRRERLYGMSLLRRDLRYRATPTLVISFLLLLIALGTLAAIVFRITI